MKSSASPSVGVGAWTPRGRMVEGELQTSQLGVCSGKSWLGCWEPWDSSKRQGGVRTLVWCPAPWLGGAEPRGT